MSNKETGHRKFYDFEECDSKVTVIDDDKEDRNEDLFEYVNENIIGSCTIFSSPFGQRKVTYCDYTASGRSLKFIEDYIYEQVLPQYGSTHTTTSVTSLQTSLFRHEARDIIRNAVRASEHDRIIFTGSGATGAINRLIHGLKFSTPPIVFVDFTAHHSSLLPWREIGAKVIRVRESADGNVDLNHLEQLLQEHKNFQAQMIGCFTAASNITGVILDENAITILLHKYEALAFWDFATAAPYTDVVMNPHLEEDLRGHAHKDALYFSLHKFVGGVQTPGVLIAKKSLFQNDVPLESGGGTVFFVTRDSHRYLKDVEEREEGGTPPIVESIRGGMVMQLKMSLGPAKIEDRCRHLSQRLSELVASLPELIPLGNVSHDSRRLPILSFLISHRRSGKFLHYNFVAAILNDLFGIQSRGGCACAGPYAQDLLGMDEGLARRYERLLLEDPSLDRSHLRRKREHGSLEVLRPGFVRLNLPYTASEEQIAFIVNAVQVVAREGWKLLPQYIFNPETGEWKHHTNLVFRNRQWLQNISYSRGVFEAHLKTAPSEAPSYDQVLQEAHRILEEALKVANRMKIPDQNILFEGDTKELCWFLHPFEAKTYLKEAQAGLGDTAFRSPPFTPVRYPLSPEILKGRPDYVWRRQCQGPPSASPSSLVVSTESEEGKGDRAVSDLSQDESEKHQDEYQIAQEGYRGISKETYHDSSQEIYHDAYQETYHDTNSDVYQDAHQTTSQNISQNNNHVSHQASQGTHHDTSPVCANGLCQPRIEARQSHNQRKESHPPRKETSHQSKIRCWVSPPKSIFNATVEAVQSLDMIRPDDKVLVCLSGGKDSLSLLHTLRQYQFYTRAKGKSFTLGAVTVDPQSSSYDPRPLIPYLKSLGVPYLYEEQGILKQAMQIEDLNSICSFCSRMKRGRLYAAARREKYNVLALGQHLDDLAESFLMSVFHNGRLRTMKASYTVREEDLRIIRPFVYVREKDLRKFAESNKLPVIPENCPACFESPKERHRMKQLLAQQEVLFPNLFWSLRTALLPLLSITKTGIENSIFGKRPTRGDGREEEEEED